jgi:hypothetical protein
VAAAAAPAQPAPPLADPRHQAFAQALARIGLNPTTVQAIKDKGFNSIDNLLDIADNQINKLVKHIGQW